MADAYNIVGFQCHLGHGEQKRYSSSFRGWRGAEFIRFGQMHRNTLFVHLDCCRNSANEG
jgi:methylenetetrahydrofolate--tRNA-(uracil-5-)-methyltransferase